MVKVIKDSNEYTAAMTRLEELIAAKPTSGSPQEEELELLSVVIDDYERSILPRLDVSPIEAIRLRMDQMNLKPKDLEPYLGARSKVSEVLSGKRTLSLEMIRKLHRGLDIPAEVLLGSEDTVDLSELETVDYTKFPLAEMYERGCFPDFKGTVRDLKDYAAEVVRRFLGDVTLTPVLRRATQAQRGNKATDELAMIAWRVCVLKKARAQKVTVAFDRSKMTDAWFMDLVQLSRFAQGPQLAVEFLAQSGISLVVQKHFSKTFLDGAAMLDGTRPVVAVTLRHDRVDNFWFVLLHELAHVKKHLTPELNLIEDDLDSGSDGLEREQEADDLANQFLIPPIAWTKIKQRLPMSADELRSVARELKIAPSIVAGRIRHETKNYKLYTGIIGRKGQVSPLFGEETPGA